MAIQGSLSKNFAKKWTNHTHAKTTLNCNKVLVLDGNWKCNRLKCTYDNTWKKSIEFGEIRLGCPRTPQRGSYYCNQHKDYKLSFQVNGTFLEIAPKDIKLSRISK